MAITKDFNRQCVMSALLTINFGDLAGLSGTDVGAVSLPPNAIVTGGAVVVKTAFNSATSDVIDVGDSVSQNRYLNATATSTQPAWSPWCRPAMSMPAAT